MPGDHHPEEAYWGFFTGKRAPKPIMADLAACREGAGS